MDSLKMPNQVPLAKLSTALLSVVVIGPLDLQSDVKQSYSPEQLLRDGMFLTGMPRAPLPIYRGRIVRARQIDVADLPLIR
jgi:hypothetical protein